MEGQHSVVNNKILIGLHAFKAHAFHFFPYRLLDRLCLFESSFDRAFLAAVFRYF